MQTSDANNTESGAKPVKRGRRVARLVALSLLVWFLSIFAAEGAFRLAGVRVVAAMGGFYEAFGDQNYRHKPNAAAFHDWFSGDFWAYTDQQGFRVGASERSRRLDAVDVLVLGDSQAFGQGVDYEASIIGQFAKRAAGAGLTVANAAVGGHAIRDQVEVARALAKDRGLRPKVILVTMTPRSIAYPNDLSKAIVIDGALWDAAPTAKDHVRRWFASRSAVFGVVKDAGRNIRNKLKPAQGPKLATDLISIYEVGAVQAQRAESFGKAVRELETMFSGEAPRIVLAYFPLAAETEVEAVGKGSGKDVSQRAPADTAAKLAGLLSAPLIDGSGPLAARREAGQAITLNGDNHYGPETSEAVAELLWNGADWAGLARR
jgi:hypothetical protein